MRMLNSKCDNKYVFKFLSQNPISTAHLKNYLKCFDEKGL